MLRRRIVVVIVLVIGTGAAWLFAVADTGETSFYWLTFALAAVWTVGTFASGPLHLGSIYWRGRNQRPVISGGGMVAAPDPR